MEIGSTLKKIDAYRRGVLAELRDKLLPSQKEIFDRVYPCGVKKMPDSKINWAIEQCERTIAKNIKLGRTE